MSVWIQSLFSALLPLPHKLMWQKMENHEWLCLRLVWGTVTTVWSRGAPRRQAHLSLGEKRDDFPWQPFAQWGASSPRAGAEHGAKGLTCVSVGKPGAPPPVAAHPERSCCREVPAQLRSAGGEADACPASRWWSHSSAAFVPGGGNVS